MWRWYVEVAFLVLVCFAAGAALAASCWRVCSPRPSDARRARHGCAERDPGRRERP